MAKPRQAKWQPTTIRRFVHSLPTSAGTMLVVTDAGEAYLKAMGNDAGEHALACEWVGTQLARWLGLPTFDFGLIEVSDVNELPFAAGGFARPGPAFVTRAEAGEPWGGKKRELGRLVNPQDIGPLVVFDTWTLNCDRHSQKKDGTWRVKRDNVFLSEEAPPGQLLLKASDHTHCFTCGSDLTAKIATIARIQEPGIFGLFREFRSFLDRHAVERTVERLNSLTKGTVQEIVGSIPAAWDVSPGARDALVSLILSRAKYVAGSIIEKLWPQKDLHFTAEAEDPP